MVYLNDVKSTNGLFFYLYQILSSLDAERNKTGTKNSLRKRIYMRLGKIKERAPRYLKLH